MTDSLKQKLTATATGHGSELAGMAPDLTAATATALLAVAVAVEGWQLIWLAGPFWHNATLSDRLG